MNIARNMEVIFLVTVALFCATAYAAPRIASTQDPVIVSGEMTVVTITATRLTPAQKAGLVD